MQQQLDPLLLFKQSIDLRCLYSCLGRTETSARHPVQDFIADTKAICAPESIRRDPQSNVRYLLQVNQDIINGCNQFSSVVPENRVSSLLMLKL
jgi:hypothetical protein